MLCRHTQQLLLSRSCRLTSALRNMRASRLLQHMMKCAFLITTNCFDYALSWPECSSSSVDRSFEGWLLPGMPGRASETGWSQCQACLIKAVRAGYNAMWFSLHALLALRNEGVTSVVICARSAFESDSFEGDEVDCRVMLGGSGCMWNRSIYICVRHVSKAPCVPHAIHTRKCVYDTCIHAHICVYTRRTRGDVGFHQGFQ